MLNGEVPDDEDNKDPDEDVAVVVVGTVKSSKLLVDDIGAGALGLEVMMLLLPPPPNKSMMLLDEGFGCCCCCCTGAAVIPISRPSKSAVAECCC